jgi:hypothetical protein
MIRDLTRCSEQTENKAMEQPNFAPAALGPPNARVLDLTGPWEVFSRVNEVLTGQHPGDKPGFEVEA